MSTGPALAALALLSLSAPQDPARLSDDALEQRFRELAAGGWGWNPDAHAQDAVVLEIIRRGGPHWDAVLAAELERLQTPRVVGEGIEVPQADLVVLTALRRVQGKSDPLAIEVRPGAGETSSGTGEPGPARFPDLPVLHATVRNVDADGHAFSFQRSGDYRGGRNARWDVEVRAANGTPVECAIDWPLGMGGGLSSRDALPPGETWELDLPLFHYVLLPAPGEYEVRVLYHDTQTIADAPDPSQFVTSSSAWLPLVSAPREDAITAAEVCRAVAWIDALAEGETVLLTSAHRTGTEKHDTVPVTAQEELYWLGWKAVPLLIDALDDDGRDAHARAWILATLWSITGLHDPRVHPRTLGSYEIYLDSMWTAEGGMLGAHGSGSDSGPDGEAQAELVRRWQELRAGMTLRIEG